jgi:hypothetical protein
MSLFRASKISSRSGLLPGVGLVNEADLVRRQRTNLEFSPENREAKESREEKESPEAFLRRSILGVDAARSLVFRVEQFGSSDTQKVGRAFSAFLGEDEVIEEDDEDPTWPKLSVRGKKGSKQRFQRYAYLKG